MTLDNFKAVSLSPFLLHWNLFEASTDDAYILWPCTGSCKKRNWCHERVTCCWHSQNGETTLLLLGIQFRHLYISNMAATLAQCSQWLMFFLTNIFFCIKMEPLPYGRMNFDEFCAAAISVYQLEATAGWESIATRAFEYFEQEGNRVISVHELVQVSNSLKIRITIFYTINNCELKYKFSNVFRKWIWVLLLILFSKIGQELLMGNSVFLDIQDFCMVLQYATLIQDINTQKHIV